MTDATSEAPEAVAPVDTAMSADEAVLALTDSGDDIEQDQTADTPPADEDVDPLLAVINEDQSAEDPETPAIEAPRSWGADDKAVFATLSPEAQAIVLAREEDRDRATSKAVTEAGQARTQAQQEAAAISNLRVQMDAFLPQALQTFASRWEGIDWAAEAQRDPVAAFQAKAQFESEQAQINQLQAAQQQAQAVEHQNHVRTVAAELQTIAPDLSDPKEGPARVSALSKFLTSDLGYTPDTLKWATANDLSVAYDAMRYRQLQAKAKQALTRTPSAPSKPVKPAGAGDRAAPEQRDARAIRNRFAQTGKHDDAIALIIAQGL